MRSSLNLSRYSNVWWILVRPQTLASLWMKVCTFMKEIGFSFHSLQDSFFLINKMLDVDFLWYTRNILQWGFLFMSLYGLFIFGACLIFKNAINAATLVSNNKNECSTPLYTPTFTFTNIYLCTHIVRWSVNSERSLYSYHRPPPPMLLKLKSSTSAYDMFCWHKLLSFC